MSTKEYLSQAFRLNERINSKLEQIQSLNDLATNCSAVISDMPRNPNCGGSPMADAIIKIISLQDEINDDIDKMVDLKRELVSVVKEVKDVECQILLELRYLCFHSWEDIAVEMGYTVRNIHYLHKQALRLLVVPK